MSQQPNETPEQWHLSEGASINPACDMRLPTSSTLRRTSLYDRFLLHTYSSLTSSPDILFPRPKLYAPKPLQQGGRTVNLDTGVYMNDIDSPEATRPEIETNTRSVPVHELTAKPPAKALLDSREKHSRLPLDNVARKIPQKVSEYANDSLPENIRIEADKAKPKVEYGRVRKQRTRRKVNASSPSLTREFVWSAYNPHEIACLKREDVVIDAFARRRRVSKARFNGNDIPKRDAHEDQVMQDNGGEETSLKREDVVIDAFVRRRRVSKARFNENDIPKRDAHNDQVMQDDGGEEAGLKRSIIERNEAQGIAQTQKDPGIQITESISILCPPPPRKRLSLTLYNRTVPKLLKGTQKALGSANWNAYVALLEQRRAGAMDEDKFAAATKAIFLTYDDSVLKRINEAMFLEMSKPGWGPVKGEERKDKR